MVLECEKTLRMRTQGYLGRINKLSKFVVFPLVCKTKWGNLKAHKYREWIARKKDEKRCAISFHLSERANIKERR